MEGPLQHPVINWFLIIIAFIASFNAGWKALEYINRAPTPTPKLEYQMREPEIPSQESPAFLIEDRSWRSPREGSAPMKPALAVDSSETAVSLLVSGNPPHRVLGVTSREDRSVCNLTAFSTVAVPSGFQSSGTYTGSVIGKTFTINFSGQITVGDSCTVNGTFVGSRP